ncbi:predicted protein [Naegleria gruberi]|uniref:Predicted protein n=1 Tax=Naegleria gruberi TaxID=5762 RepID=D2VEP7_NAEGR|nr:uncharacterized protein NAEGRDRAFT_67348 [Naegleria gruberi]EFC44544.1 predicted protein [Naegleria gruberi]|eukprot:XP_002677288.1 predicted protein [Naegleria gruberi strain NEG-M]
MSLSHAVFPGEHVFKVSSTSVSEFEPFKIDDTNSDLTKIADAIYQKVVHLPNINVVKVISGRHHTHLITFEGRILSFGTNGNGELCCGVSGALGGSPIRGLIRAEGVINEYKIIDGAGGGYHSIFISIDGSVFVNGSNSANQLGISDTESQKKPVKLPSDYFDGQPICKVGANNTHSVFITRNSQVYVAGSDSNGCCAGIKSSSVPLLLKFPIQFTPIDVSCGYDDTKFLTSQGDYDIYITKEFNPKTKGFGFIRKLDGTDLTGEFNFNDLVEQVGISSQRNHFIIHTYRDDYNPIHEHFIFFIKLIGNDRLPLNDIKFIF